MKKQKSVLLFIAALLGLIYIFYSISYWSNAGGGTDSAEAIGAGVATLLVLPHLLCAGLASVFNVLAYFMRHRAFALTAGILYSVAMLLFPMYFMFTVVQAVLCYIAFARMKKPQPVQEPEQK